MNKTTPARRRGRSRRLQDLPAAAAEAAALLRAMANPQRMLVLCHLADGEQSVGALQGQLGISQSALSQHLAKLRDGELVSTRREAQTVFYSLPDGPVRAVMATLHDIYCA
ncbi:MAG: helix-turn-helix transcriptional regulator [Arenimonas sp.]|nr:helix-turn-helix transcriptional regulator [Arenimonas sp.]